MCPVEVMCGISNDSTSGSLGKGCDINIVNVELTLTTAGGMIVCLRCNAMSKRTKLQCGGPAMQGKTKCKFHGGLSTGARTDEGANCVVHKPKPSTATTPAQTDKRTA